jgi:hypothetical protein
MGQKKLKRFAEIKTFDNVLEYPENIKGNWKDFFKDENRAEAGSIHQTISVSFPGQRVILKSVYSRITGNSWI